MKGSLKPFKEAVAINNLRAKLMAGFDKGGDEPLQGRLLIIEDLTRDVIEELGDMLNIDPLFFASHIHTPRKGEADFQSPDTSTLPSRTRPRDFANIHYHRSLTFDVNPPRKRLLRQANIDRKVMILPGSTPVIGLAQHCVSIYRIDYTSYWIGVVLVDPPIRGTYFYDDGGKSLVQVNLRSSLYLGGYEDFLDEPLLGEGEILSPPRRGLLEDLLYYWTSLPPHFNTASPSLMSFSYYPVRVVAAEWVKYITVMQTSIKQYEYSNKGLSDFLDELQKLHSDLRVLQSWRRRIMSTKQKLKATSRLLRSWQAGNSDDSETVAPMLEDYRYIAGSVNESGRRLEDMLPVAASLVQIVDSQRSFAETTNITRLTILALVFVPLTFVSSLFSMNATNGPGGPYFWVYFAVAVPVTVVVIAVASPPVRGTKGIWDGFQNWRTSRGNTGQRRNVANSLNETELGAIGISHSLHK
ncbi:MAG: hypothetical protein M1822_008911 [Bathelium mastoideum]|nr:MAG: hypothetical protein M1822_008911 [Bathelium mastoideum]